jgi:hypothetical protein
MAPLQPWKGKSGVEKDSSLESAEAGTAAPIEALLRPNETWIGACESLGNALLGGGPDSSMSLIPKMNKIMR